MYPKLIDLLDVFALIRRFEEINRLTGAQKRSLVVKRTQILQEVIRAHGISGKCCALSQKARQGEDNTMLLIIESPLPKKGQEIYTNLVSQAMEWGIRFM